jgi:putative DNA primase/helicase
VILDIRAVANALGGEVISRNQTLAPSPGHSARDRSLSITLSNANPDGFIAHSHAHGDDAWREIRDYVKEKLGLPLGPKDRETRPAAAKKEAVREDADRAAHGLTTTADAMKLCGESVDPRNTLVEKYLNVERKLGLTLDLVGVLRWHPGIEAMLAVFRNIETGAPQAVSRTFLDHEGKKTGRMFTGPVKGAAIMLDPFENVLEGLHIGEGVETCLAARQFNLRPVWALGGTAFISTFPVLSGVECLTLLQENDRNGASQKACEKCAERWHAAGREVIINTPHLDYKDLNDAIISKPQSRFSTTEIMARLACERPA